MAREDRDGDRNLKGVLNTLLDSDSEIGVIIGVIILASTLIGTSFVTKQDLTKTNNKIDEIKKTIDNIDTKTSKNSSKVIVLENKIDSLSSQLEKEKNKRVKLELKLKELNNKIELVSQRTER